MKPIFSVLLVIYTGSNLITDISVGGDHVGPGAGQGGRRGGAQPPVGPGVGGAGVAPVGNHFGPMILYEPSLRARPDLLLLLLLAIFVNILN